MYRILTLCLFCLYAAQASAAGYEGPQERALDRSLQEIESQPGTGTPAVSSNQVPTTMSLSTHITTPRGSSNRLENTQNPAEAETAETDRLNGGNNR